MSNNLVSQQMSMQNIQIGQLEPVSNKLDSSMQMAMMGQGVNSPALQQMSMPADMQMGMMGLNSGDASSLQISVSSHQTQPYEYMPNNHVLQKLSVSNMQMGQMGQRSYNLVSDQFLPPNKQLGGMETVFNTVGQQSSVLSKRKMPMDSYLDTQGLQKLASNKRVAHVEHRPWLHESSSANKLSVQTQSQSSSYASGSPRPQAQSKRSTSTKAGPQPLSVQKNQSGQPSPKYKNESSESVRSKLRESLGAALALVSQEQDKSSSVGEQSQNTGTQGNSQTSGRAFNHVIEENKESLPDKGHDASTQNKGGQNSIPLISSKNSGVYTETSRIDALNSRSIFSSLDESVSVSDGLFVKDELLQGNGLSWVLESSMGLDEKREEAQTVGKQPDMGDSCVVSGGQHIQSPEVLASKIEAELYKLYGGVNKKYKEKGRSLLFNLKDRSNPELREKVMSGDIAPDRLCAMTAEELASKELSEWRMAKAEELAQMVVLPDSDGDMRRLVKKTHKGEFQVEVEPQDSISVEVAVGTSSLTRVRPKPREKDGSSPSRPDKKKNKGNSTGEKGSSEDQNVIMIPSSDGSDLMQGLMVDDELKDAEFLPPIVSLDEFMESLNAEPPFENLPVDAGKATTVSDKDDTQVGSESKSPDNAASGKSGTVDLASAKLDSDGKSAEELVKSETVPSVSITKGELVWEGLLQLNLSSSSSASVVALFKSGEKAFAKAWPGLVEIKGRVRLDAFEKFLQELPMSRSRAVMAVQFVCKEGSSESERASIKEVADSYVVDERVGFAEPASGVELYVCPPDSKTREMLSKILPKDQLDALNSIDNGLIGVIVWRKPHLTSTITPNHKHNSKKQTSSSRKNLEKDATNNITSKHHGDGTHSFSKSQPNAGDDEDDVPPGFGPPAGAARDDDDLPEFNFSSGPVTPRPQAVKKSGIQGQGMPFHTHPQSLPRPVDQMRELVHKYGQTETNNSRGVMVQPWNNDDDDDMPEWHPDDAKPQPQPQSVFMRNSSIQQPMLRAHVMQQTNYHPQTQQTLSLPPQVNVMQPPQTPWQQQQGQWMPPNSAYPPSNGQPWRRDTPTSRGF